MPENRIIGRPVNRENTRPALAPETSKVGKRGTIVMPARFRKKFGIAEGTLVIAEEREDGILIRPAVAYPVEIYTRERKAEFILSGAVDEQDYEAARNSVREMGLDPDRIPHSRPVES